MSEVIANRSEAWEVKPLSDLAEAIQYGYTAKAKTDEDGIRYLRITDIQDDHVDWSTVPSCDVGEAESKKYLLSAGDLVFARTGATVGKSFLIRGNIPKSVFASYLIRVKLRKHIDPRYIAHFFQSTSYWNQIAESSAGIGQPNVNGKKLAQIQIPVAPRAQQAEIVAELEKQFSRLDEAVASLQRVKANLKRYKASVLKAAVEGRLVETEVSLAHREGRTFETGEQLLQRILEERRAKWSGRGKYKEPPAVESHESPEVPSGWGKATIGSVCLLDSGEAFKKHDYSTAGLKLLQIANVGFGKTDWEQKNYLPGSFGERFAELLLQVGDIVLALNRPVIGGQLKIASVSSGDLPAILYQRVGRLRPVDLATVAYLFVFFQSKSMLAAVRSRLQGTDQPYLNTSLVPEIPVSLPPLAEQVRIVAEVDRHLSIVREVEAEVDTNLRRAQALRQATLAKAYSQESI